MLQDGSNVVINCQDFFHILSRCTLKTKASAYTEAGRSKSFDLLEIMDAQLIDYLLCSFPLPAPTFSRVTSKESIKA